MSERRKEIEEEIAQMDTPERAAELKKVQKRLKEVQRERRREYDRVELETLREMTRLADERRARLLNESNGIHRELANRLAQIRRDRAMFNARHALERRRRRELLRDLDEEMDELFGPSGSPVKRNQ